MSLFLLCPVLLNDLTRHTRKIITYHAEDGSGIGSAIVAGQYPRPMIFIFKVL